MLHAIDGYGLYMKSEGREDKQCLSYGCSQTSLGYVSLKDLQKILGINDISNLIRMRAVLGYNQDYYGQDESMNFHNAQLREAEDRMLR